MRSRLHRSLRLAVGGLVLAAAVDLAAVKRDLLAARPALLASLVAAAALLALGWLAASALAVRRGPRRGAALGEALVAAGLTAMAAGGLANWAYGMQGFVLLHERQPVRLGPATLESFTCGPLADLRELDLTLALARLRFRAAGREGFKPRSELRLLDAAGEEEGLAVEVGRAAAHRDLWLHQGAFGFSPHLVVAAGGKAVLDEYVPFRTVVDGKGGVAFAGELTVAAARLALRGTITLDDLDDEMRGHPTLELELSEGGGPPRRVALKPGEMADLEGRLRVGFTGLRRWAEIDVSRRTYRAPVLAGGALLALGALTWGLAAWRGRRAARPRV